jgi:hypothetical protein
MSDVNDPRFEGIDFEHSYLLGVIYDDESLTLEMEFNLTADHPRYAAPADGEEGCFRQGFVRFADIEDLQISKARPGKGQADYSTVYSLTGDGQKFEVSSGWGEIKVAAGSVRVALDG